MSHPFLCWSAWSIVTVAWTAALVLPVTGPEFGATEEMRSLTRLIFAKCAHVSVYAVWAFVTGWFKPPLKVRIYLLMFLMAHAVGSEWCQWLLRDLMGRDGSLRDAALDQCGILIGVLAGFRWWTAPDEKDTARGMVCGEQPRTK